MLANILRFVISGLVEGDLDMDNDQIFVDLDGTLAHYTNYKAMKGEIGEPIPKMLERVKKWIREGKEVVIFTARANDRNEVSKIREWVKKHVGKDLEVTNIKSPRAIAFWDDRAMRIKKNTGEVEAGEE
ncbi:MAG: hypothetical protein HQK96_18530 [Nitrospirae bacterium]|nr:hypothetical protein [Nitrospirota bacterium]